MKKPCVKCDHFKHFHDFRREKLEDELNQCLVSNCDCPDYRDPGSKITGMRKTIVSEHVQRDFINSLVQSIHVKPSEKPTDEEIFQVRRNRALVMISYVTAGRISEVLELKKENFDFRRPGSDQYEVVDMVNLKNRNRQHKTIGFHKQDTFSPEIKRFVSRLETPESYVFPMRKTCFGWAYETINKPMSRRTALRIVKSLDPDIWCHWFRHQRLSHLGRMGFTDRQLMGVSGHVSSEMLSVYVDMSSEIYEGKMRPG